jgi:uncharacterized membrane protein
MVKKANNSFSKSLKENLAKDENPEQDIEILDKLPEDERNSVIKQLSMKSYSGPVMPPEYAEHYEQIVKGSAREILDMAKQQINHRMECEKKALDAQIEEARFDSKRANNGMIGAFFLILVLIVAGCGMTWKGHENFGITALGVLGLASFSKIIQHFIPSKSKND